MNTTRAVQNEMIYTIFPLQEVLCDIPFLFVPSSAFPFLFVNKDNIRKFLFDNLGYAKTLLSIILTF